MSQTQMALVGALLLSFIGGCMYGRSSDGDSQTAAANEDSNDGEGSDREQAGNGGGQSSGGGAQSGGNASRDQRLVGNWRYTETYASDGYSFVSDQFMTISGDGTMSIRDGSAAGGGGDFTWDQPASGQAVSCEWRTQGNIIEVRGNGHDWTPMAEYEISGDTLMTTSQGERQIWERI